MLNITLAVLDVSVRQNTSEAKKKKGVLEKQIFKLIFKFY